MNEQSYPKYWIQISRDDLFFPTFIFMRLWRPMEPTQIQDNRFEHKTLGLWVENGLSSMFQSERQHRSWTVDGKSFTS